MIKGWIETYFVKCNQSDYLALVSCLGYHYKCGGKFSCSGQDTIKIRHSVLDEFLYQEETF